jgi:hydrogenase-4 component E
MTLHHLTVPEAFAGTVAMLLLLVQLSLFRSVVIAEFVRIYIVQAWLVAAICFGVGLTEGAWDLIVLAALTLVFKGVLLPRYMQSLAKGISARVELPARINVLLSLLIAGGLIGLSILTSVQLPLHQGAFLPRADLATTLSMVFIGFLVAILRPNALAQVVAFLTLENGLFFGTVTLAPGLPFVIGILLLIDVLVAVVVFAVLVRALVGAQAAASVHVFEKLRG